MVFVTDGLVSQQSGFLRSKGHTITVKVENLLIIKRYNSEKVEKLNI